MSTPPERFLEQATQIVRRLSNEGQRLARRRRRRLTRIIKGVLWMVVAPFIIIPAMIASGLLLGPRGIEGLIAAPLALFATWGVIAYVTFFRRVRPRSMAKAELAALPAYTEEWLEDARRWLPLVAQPQVDRIAQQLEIMQPQFEGIEREGPAAVELRRLLGQELPELVRGYRKVPAALAREPLYGGASPEQRLIEGLETIDKQLRHMHERLAADGVHAWATHQRYLDLKYKRDRDLE